MATGDFFGTLKRKVRSVYNNFFYEGEEAPAPQPVQEAPAAAPQAQPYAPYGYPNGAYAPQQGYQPQYQQAAPQPEQPRNRRTQQHAGQYESNVVDFGAYQQHQQQAYQQPQYQQPVYQQQPAYQQQAAQPAPAQQPAPQQAAAQSPAPFSARIINARGMGDCRSAITLLRNGDAVLIVLENVTDPAEMRRLVDTLSGACYSLTATITKVSRYGSYLLAPQTMAVYADQVTNQMNGAPGRMQQRGYQPQQRAYAQMNGYQQPQQGAYQQPYAAPQGGNGFTQRSAAPDEGMQPFYARSAPQAAQMPAFSTQPAGYGYAPDESEAVAE